MATPDLPAFSARPDSPVPPTWSVGRCATFACLLEVTAPKPGNVHRGADFDDLTYFDFIASAAAIGPVIDGAQQGRRVGEVILDAVTTIEQCVSHNTYLGTILLIVPLAAVPRDVSLVSGIGGVLARLTQSDSRDVYEAIRRARPGGMGTVAQHDIRNDAPADLLVAMRAAADRDLVARQYANNFADVLSTIAPWLRESLQQGHSANDAIVRTQLRMLARFPDSLIARKCGPPLAKRVADQAAHILTLGDPADDDYQRGLADLDFYLRSDGHRRNPGTTADLIAAALFTLLREGELRPPWNQ